MDFFLDFGIKDFPPVTLAFYTVRDLFTRPAVLAALLLSICVLAFVMAKRRANRPASL